jgi:phosphohistidine phosphatase
MKRIIIVRHAKSSWASLDQTDFDRPLNERGLTDAPEMGKRLHSRRIAVDAVVSSNAKRAKQTAQAIAAQLPINEDHIIYEDCLYHAPALVINDVVRNLPNDLTTVLVVCHNNGITNWVNEQSDTQIDNMPTCGMACFEAMAVEWNNFFTTPRNFVFIDYPKLQNFSR